MNLLNDIQYMISYVWTTLFDFEIYGIKLKIIFLGFLLISICIDVIVHILQDA